MSFIPGMTGAVAGVGKAFSVSVISNTAAQASTIAWPDGLAAGDVAVLMDMVSGTIFGTPEVTLVTPSGFDAVVSQKANIETIAIPFPVSAEGGVVLSKKLLAGTESGSISGMIGAGFIFKRLLILRGTRAINGVGVHSAQYSVSSSEVVSKDIASSGVGKPSLAVAGLTRKTAASFSTETPTFGTKSTQNNGTWFNVVGHTIYNPDDAIASHTVDGSGAGALAGCFLSFT